MHLEVSPFHGLQPVCTPDQATFAAGLLGVCEEEARLVNAINRAVVRQAGSCHAGEPREQIDGVHDFVAQPTGGIRVPFMIQRSKGGDEQRWGRRRIMLGMVQSCAGQGASTPTSEPVDSNRAYWPVTPSRCIF